MTLRLVSQGGLLNNQLIKEDPLILDTMKETDDIKASFGDVGDVYPDSDFNSETKYIRDSSPIAATNIDGTAVAGTYDDTVLYAGTSGLGRYGVSTLGLGGLGMVSSLASWADNEVVRWHGASGAPTIVQGSSIFIDDSQNMTGLGNVTFTGVMVAGSGSTQITTAVGLLRHQAIDPDIAGSGITYTSGVLSVTSGLSGSGTENTIPLWGAGGVVLGDSALTQSGGNVTAAGNFASNGIALDLLGTNVGAAVTILCRNQDDTAGSDAFIAISTEGAGGGNPYVQFGIGDVGQFYSLGIDNSDSDKLVGSVGNALGTANWLEVTTAGDTLLTGNTTITQDLTITSGNVEISAGGLGIGVAAPATGLHIQDNTTVTLTIEDTSANGIAKIDLINDVVKWTLRTNSNDSFRLLQDDTTVPFIVDPGASTNQFRLRVAETVLNDSGLDINFRVEAAGSPNAYFVEGSSGNVSVGTGDFTATVGDVLVPVGIIKIGNATTVTPNIVADDFVIDRGAVTSGMTLVSTTVANWIAADAGSNIAGVLSYTHSGDTWNFDIGGTREVTVSDGVVTIDAKGKIGFTSIGGYAVKLTNKTGSGTVKGKLVVASTTTDDAFGAAGVNAENVIGAVLEAGIADGNEAWVVVGGKGEVLMDAGGCTHGDRLGSGTTAGSASTLITPSLAEHFREIGHSVQTVGAGALARTDLHFN